MDLEGFHHLPFHLSLWVPHLHHLYLLLLRALLDRF
jgi:hypothetical protein